MAQKRTIDIDIKNNAGETAKDFDNLSKATNRAADSADRLDATFEEVYGELQPLTTRMGEAEDRLYELALAGDTTSKEYNDLLKSVGNYRKVQIQTDLAVDAAATTLSQKLGGALTGATSGFAAVQGVMGLVGSESEALEETLLKVQSALALQQGVQGVLEYSKSIGLAGKATKVFNLIVKANPLALLATTLIAIIGYFAVFTDAIDVAIQGLKDFGDWIGLTNFAEQKLEDDRKKRHKAELKRRKLVNKIAQQAQKDAKENADKEKIELEKRQAAYEAYVAARIAAARQIQDLEIQIMDEGMQKELAMNQLRFDRLIEDTKKNTELNAKERKRITEIFLFQQQEAENDIRNKFRREELDEEENQIVSLQGVVEKGNQLTLDGLKNQADKEIKISREKNKKLEELEALSSDRKRELAVNAASDTFSTLANLAELFAGESKKQQKRAFKVQKAANIAQATVDTFSSAIAAYKSQAAIPVVGPVLGGIAAAAAVSAGLLNIKKISQQRFDSGGGGGEGGADFAPSGGGAQAPEFNVVGDSGVNQLAQLQQQPTQAFVVSGEVTTAQALDRNRVQNATL